MKRATFTIPLAGISLAACGDPIIATWDAVLLDGDVLPAVGSFTNANGVNCDYVESFTLVVNDDLSAQLTYKDDTVCDDGATYNYLDVYNGATVVVDKKAKYTINFNIDGANVALNCDLDANKLNCLYDGTPFNFVLKE